MAMSARQVLQELGRRQAWLVSKVKEKKRLNLSCIPEFRELESIGYAMNLVEMKVHENAANHESPAAKAASGITYF